MKEKKVSENGTWHVAVSHKKNDGTVEQEREYCGVNLGQALRKAYAAVHLASKATSPTPRVNYYDASEMKKLLDAIKGDRFELFYKLMALYGLRRGETLGLKWDAIDFEKDTISIHHQITLMAGKIIKADIRSKLGRRMLPLLPEVKEALLTERERQEQNKAQQKEAYCSDDSEYVFVNDSGKLINAETVNEHFKLGVIKRKGLPEIRLQDLRRSCTAMLLGQRTSMDVLQAWLGSSLSKTIS